MAQILLACMAVAQEIIKQVASSIGCRAPISTSLHHAVVEDVGSPRIWTMRDHTGVVLGELHLAHGDAPGEHPRGRSRGRGEQRQLGVSVLEAELYRRPHRRHGDGAEGRDLDLELRSKQQHSALRFGRDGDGFLAIESVDDAKPNGTAGGGGGGGHSIKRRLLWLPIREEMVTGGRQVLGFEDGGRAHGSLRI